MKNDSIFVYVITYLCIYYLSYISLKQTKSLNTVFYVKQSSAD